jgi:hypothetical protein
MIPRPVQGASKRTRSNPPATLGNSIPLRFEMTVFLTPILKANMRNSNSFPLRTKPVEISIQRLQTFLADIVGKEETSIFHQSSFETNQVSQHEEYVFRKKIPMCVVFPPGAAHISRIFSFS